MDGFLGQIYYFGGNFAPRNFAYCEGQLLPISQWSALYSILGVTFGGDGRTTFGLPDMRGRFAISSGSSSADPYNFVPGEKGGTTTVTLTESQLPSHTHSATLTLRGTAGSSPSPTSGGSLGATPGGGQAAGALYSSNPLNNPVQLSDNSIAVQATGSSHPFSIIPPYQAIPSIICTAGLYPSRN
jgi:microcystin-dependent protein